MKNWGVWLAFVLATLIAAAGIYGSYRWWLADPASMSRSGETVAVQRGPLTVQVRSFGVVTIPRESTLTFGMSGALKELDVAEGDTVREGKVLARLDTSDLELQVARAEAALALSQAQMQKLREGSAAADIAAAQAAIKSAEQNLEEVKQGPTEADMAVAQAALATAQQDLSDLLRGPTDLELQQAQLALDQARNALWGAQGNRDALDGQPGASGGLKANAKAQVANAEVAVRQAELRLEELKTPPTPAEIQDARARVAQAQDNITELQQSPTAADVAAAEAQLVQAQARLDVLTLGPSAQDIAIAQAQVEQSQVSLAQAKRQIEASVLVAPIGGTAVAISANVGQWLSAGSPIVVLADLSSLQVQAYVHESYVGQLQPGQRALVQLDAFPEQQFEGRVSKIASLAPAAGSLLGYPVTIDLVPPAVPVKPGMTAEVRIVAVEKEAALTVPRGALWIRGGQWMVRAQRGGRLQDVQVVTGTRQERMVEIVDGLEEGDQVLLHAVPILQQGAVR